VVVEILVHFVVPVRDLGEAFAVSDVIEDDDAVGIAVVGVGDGAKAILSGCIPLR
jgi:hypothetical protein